MATEVKKIGLKDAVERLRIGVERAIERRIRVGPCHTNRASQIGFPCIRELVYERARWGNKRKPSVELQLIFDQGRAAETFAVQRLREAGIEIIEQQRPFEDKNLQLTGHIEGTMIINGVSYLFEIKSMHPYQYSRIDVWQDFLKHPIYCKWPAQGQMYMYLAEVPEMIFIIVDKGTGQMKFLPMEIDLEYCETLLQKIELVNAYVAEDKLPDRIEWDSQICGRYCDFYHICCPAIKGEGTKILDNDLLEEMLEHRAQLQPVKKEYEEVDKAIAKKIEGVENTLVGRFIINGKWVEVDVKPKPASHYKYWKKEIKEIKQK